MKKYLFFLQKKNSTDKLKLVIFDEADILSQESQNLLRRNIEIYSEKQDSASYATISTKLFPLSNHAVYSYTLNVLTLII